MELWVRSQNKEKLIKVNNIGIFHHYSYKDTQEKYLLPSGSFEWRNVQKKDKYIKSVIACNDEITLGTYKSKERALEILDEIQNILKPVIITTEYECNMKDNPRDKTHFNLEMKPEKTEIQQITSYVYEMPEE